MKLKRRFFITIGLSLIIGLVLAQNPPLSGITRQKQQLSQVIPDSTRLRLCLAIAQSYYATAQYDSLSIYAQQGLHYFRQSPNHAYAAELYFLLSRYYRNKGEYRQGVWAIRQAVTQAQRSNNPKRTIEFQYYLAALYLDADDLSKAIDQIGVNLRYLQHHEDGPTRGANYLLMIVLYQELKNTALEEQYWHCYFALDKRSWPVEDKMIFHLNMAEYLEKKGQFRQAEPHLRKARYYAAFTPTPVLNTISVLQYLGINMRKQGKCQPAIELFNQAFEKAKAIKSVGFMSGAKRELVLTYQVSRQMQKAITEARNALLLSRQNKERAGIIASLTVLSDVLETQGKFKEALILYREAHQLNEQKFTETNVKRIMQMQARFDAETKENAIRVLQKNAKINQLNLLRQREQLIWTQRTQLGSLLLSSLLVLVVGVIIYSQRKLRKSYTLLGQQQAELQQTASQLAETNLVKDKLFSLISHDLRSPVAGMKMVLRQIQQVNQPDPSTLTTLLARLDNQVDVVLTLLTNLLDWSMIRLKGYQPVLQPITVGDVTSEAISLTSELIRQKRLTIIDQVPAEACLMADHHQLATVVRNILTNAIKFTPPEGYIRLHTVVGRGWVELQIRDTGIGMSESQLTDLFHAPQVRQGTVGERGTGLGLQICRELTERQGGQLYIESTVDQGTVVRIRLAACQEEILTASELIHSRAAYENG